MSLHLDRRGLLAGAGALALAGRALPAMAQGEAGAELRALMDVFFQENLAASPELATSLGFDKGENADAKFRLSGESLADQAEDRARTASQLARLKAFDRARLKPADTVIYDAVAFSLETTDAANRLFPYGYNGAGQPYVISQLSGSYQDVPDFLGSQHTINTKVDADAYLSRLEAFATVMDGEVERVRRDVGLGVVPPDFIIERALIQMRGLRTPAAESPLVASVAARAKEKGIGGDYAAQATKIYEDKVVPALDRQIALMESLKPRANAQAGVWDLPDGEAYYRHALLNFTTTRLTPDEVHELGLEQARILSERADVLLKGQGLTQGSVGERIQALFKDPKHHFPNTDEGKVELIAHLNTLVAAMRPRLPDMFGTLPKAEVEIRRVPKFIEAGAPGGYYNRPALDGSRPGIYWINLRDSAENPTWTLPTLTWHEAIPGHHMQRALQGEADLPMIRKIAGYPAYSEGWALYSEQVAQELGIYEDDSLGEIGYLQAALFRAARLVVDTGLHAKRWSREQAIRTMTSIDGSPDSAAATEIERYCIRPGQACSYMVGKLVWVRLRDQARAELGDRFDVRAFHDATLLAGAMPLTVLDTVVQAHIAARKAG